MGFREGVAMDRGYRGHLLGCVLELEREELVVMMFRGRAMQLLVAEGGQTDEAMQRAARAELIGLREGIFSLVYFGGAAD